MHRTAIAAKSATLTVQRWGNSLAARIPAAVARSACFRVGQPVELSAEHSHVPARAIGEPKLTLAKKLAAFDPSLHGGELMATRAVGKRTSLVPGATYSLGSGPPVQKLTDST